VPLAFIVILPFGLFPDFVYHLTNLKGLRAFNSASLRLGCRVHSACHNRVAMAILLIVSQAVFVVTIAEPKMPQEKTVNDVPRREDNVNRLVDRDVQLVVGREVVVGAEFAV
jgi:hypothetical protein